MTLFDRRSPLSLSFKEIPPLVGSRDCIRPRTRLVSWDSALFSQLLEHRLEHGGLEKPAGEVLRPKVGKPPGVSSQESYTRA
jgi:hypothetical protein